MIRTERLMLRVARPDDLDAVHAIFSDARAMRYWAFLPHRTRDETAAWLTATMATPADAGEDFMIEHDGRVIGKMGFHRFPEVGFILHPDAWGRGFAREALRPVIDRGFALHRLPAIRADVDPRNAASLRLLASFGFRETGRAARTTLLGDEWCDSIYLMLVAP